MTAASGADREHAKIPGSENSENAYLGECWCQSRGDAWPCRSASGADQPTLRDQLANRKLLAESHLRGLTGGAEHVADLLPGGAVSPSLGNDVAQGVLGLGDDVAAELEAVGGGLAAVSEVVGESDEDCGVVDVHVVKDDLTSSPCQAGLDGYFATAPQRTTPEQQRALALADALQYHRYDADPRRCSCGEEFHPDYADDHLIDALLPLIEADRERAKAEAAAEALHRAAEWIAKTDFDRQHPDLFRAIADVLHAQARWSQP